jgi:two-component system sensor histidine kinase KdpD
MEARDAVFEPFQRVTDHGAGMGLGLAIARGFVDAIGGELTIEDTPGGGVTMVIALPVAAGQVGPEADPVASEGSSNR